MNTRRSFVLIVLVTIFLISANVEPTHAYVPKKGDFFNYSESVVVNNGQGSYTGYTDQTQVKGMEQVNSVNGSEVSASYSSSFQFSNNQGGSSSNSSSGVFTWSSTSYTYINGTDGQVGYSKPTYVWFAMNPSLGVGGTFYVLNTQFTILSKNYSFSLSNSNYSSFVQTIQTKGTGQYQRNDDYGVFTASYTWYEYFDPSTGYIVGYNYVEQDDGEYQGQSGSFTYTDNLFVTSTSYTLSQASPPSGGPTTTSFPFTFTTEVSNSLDYTPLIFPILVLAVLFIIGISIAVSRARSKNELPEHSPPPVMPGSPAPWESKVDLGSKPPQQVVIRDVAKVNCAYCGTLIPTTVDTCPYCGAPRK